MVTFEYYKNTFEGNLSEVEFKELEPGVCRLIDSYIKSNVPIWRVKRLVDYEIDFNDVICIQIDFIAESGGKQALNGKSDFSVSSVSTKGFSYAMSSKQIPMFNNVPLSPIMLTNLRFLLRQAGLLARCL